MQRDILTAQITSTLRSHGIQESATLEDNDALYQSILCGKSGIRQKMIEINMPLVFAKVDDFLARTAPYYDHLRWDLISAGFVGLIEAVDSFYNTKRHVDRPVGLIGAAITNSVIDCACDEATIRVPRRTSRRWRQQGCNKKAPNTVPMTYISLSTESEELQLVDAWDALNSICRTDDERTVLRLRHAGYSYPEISATQGVSKPTVCRILQRLNRRYADAN